MTEEQFWQTIEESKNETQDCEEQAKKLTQLLTRETPEEIVAFDNILAKKRIESYRWDLWGIAYIVNGGCSDDGFEYFRCWLIGQGKNAFESALIDPESAADLLTGNEDHVECEAILYASSYAYKKLTGNNIPAVSVHSSSEPEGENWEEDDLQERFPKASAKFNW